MKNIIKELFHQYFILFLFIIFIVFIIFIYVYKKNNEIDIKIYCDKDTNIEYLIYDGYKKGGITERYDINGNLKKCNIDNIKKGK